MKATKLKIFSTRKDAKREKIISKTKTQEKDSKNKHRKTIQKGFQSLVLRTRATGLGTKITKQRHKGCDHLKYTAQKEAHVNTIALITRGTRLI